MNWAVAVLIVAGCMIAWKLTSKELHDRANARYSKIDHYGWWVTLLVLLLITLAYFLFR